MIEMYVILHGGAELFALLGSRRGRSVCIDHPQRRALWEVAF